MTGIFLQAFVYLVAAVIAVPLAKRLGLGSVLGYLIAGVVIGPIIGLVGEETTTIQHFAEFGVVMMLFLVGLELEPKMLWAMRNRLMGLGGLQVGGTVAAIMGIALYFEQPWTIALAIGLIFALSSTAIVLQTFSEKGLTKTEGGKNAFSVLLFQDIAVIPMLAFIPLLALPELVEQAQNAVQTAAQHHDDLNLVADLPGWAYGIVITASIAIVVVGGHFLSRPLLKYVASSGLREIFTATALMLVIGIAALMSLVGLSPALGTFLAGVVLANSEFRHELESNIEPFKGLLLGLFFITVGAGINFSVLFGDFWLIMALTIGVMVLKALVLFILALIFRVKGSNRWLFTLSLAQA
ncbi:monovalent cation:proton antiporter-2 (CPA2) family protein, partial [Vibrio parahaemolyticus]